MRLLFELDTKDYDMNVKAFIRPSVRSIIIRENKVAMMHSTKYDTEFKKVKMKLFLYKITIIIFVMLNKCCNVEFR